MRRLAHPHPSKTTQCLASHVKLIGADWHDLAADSARSMRVSIIVDNCPIPWVESANWVAETFTTSDEGVGTDLFDFLGRPSEVATCAASSACNSSLSRWSSSTKLRSRVISCAKSTGIVGGGLAGMPFASCLNSTRRASAWCTLSCSRANLPSAVANFSLALSNSCRATVTRLRARSKKASVPAMRSCTGFTWA